MLTYGMKSIMHINMLQLLIQMGHGNCFQQCAFVTTFLVDLVLTTHGLCTVLLSKADASLKQCGFYVSLR